MQDGYKRVDAHLSSLGYCSRSEIRKFLKMFSVCIDGERVFDGSIKAHHNQITVDNEALDPETLTILMNKPSGVVCSHSDSGRLIYSLLPIRYQRRNPKISTIGRLDADTTGAILLTDDGELNHRLTSPKSSIKKIYEVTLAEPLKGNESHIFASGEFMLRGEKKPLLAAKMEVIIPTMVKLEIYEGRYHQVKRMFGAVGNRVTALHREVFADFSVDGLAFGEYKIVENLNNI